MHKNKMLIFLLFVKIKNYYILYNIDKNQNLLKHKIKILKKLNKAYAFKLERKQNNT